MNILNIIRIILDTALLIVILILSINAAINLVKINNLKREMQQIYNNFELARVEFYKELQFQLELMIKKKKDE